MALVVGALFVGYVVRSLHGYDLSIYATPRVALGIVVAACCWAVSVPLLAMTWHALLRGLDVHRPLRELTAIVGITQFAKFVPGNVAQFIGRMGMSVHRGMPAQPLAAAMVVETMMTIAAATLIGVVAGALSGIGFSIAQSHYLQLLFIAALLLLVAAGFAVLPRVTPRALQWIAPRRAAALRGNLLPTRPALVIAFLPCCATYLVVGLGLALLAPCLFPHATHNYWLLTAAFSLAWVIGFVTPGAPAGLGVRDALMVAMLTDAYAQNGAIVLVLALRIATTLGDVMAFGLGWLVLPARRAPPRPDAAAASDSAAPPFT